MTATRVLLAVFSSLFVQAAVAAPNVSTDLGLAGPVQIRVIPCDKTSFAEMAKGACDPPAIPTGLAPKQASIAHYERARTLIPYGRRAAARQALNASLDLAPNNKDALELRGRLFLFEEQWPEAAMDLQKARKLAPKDMNLRMSLGLANAYLGDAKEAEADARFVAQKNPTDAHVRTTYARILGRAGKPKEAAEELVAITSLPNASVDFMHFAILAMENKRPKEASQIIEKMHPQMFISPMVAQLRSTIFLELGEDRKAIEAIDQLLNGPFAKGGLPVSQTFPQFFMRRAMAHQRLGATKEALADALQAIENGGTPYILKFQILLRQHGFTNLEISGKPSEELTKAVVQCFSQTQCFKAASTDI